MISDKQLQASRSDTENNEASGLTFIHVTPNARVVAEPDFRFGIAPEILKKSSFLQTTPISGNPQTHLRNWALTNEKQKK